MKANQAVERISKALGFGIKAETIRKIQQSLDDDIVANLQVASPQNQMMACVGLVTLALSEDGKLSEQYNPHSFEISQDIIYKQVQKVKKYGSKAYPLSDAQIDLIVSQCLYSAKNFDWTWGV